MKPSMGLIPMTHPTGTLTVMETGARTTPNLWQDPTSLLVIVDYDLAGTTVSTSWSSIPGKKYRFEFSTDLENWTDLGFDFLAAAAPATQTETGPLNLSVIGAPAEAYFRVVVVE